jgi:hypothetical protein
MSEIKRPLKVRLDKRQIKLETPKNIAGLARTHKIIRADKAKELQFIKLCSQIRLDEYRQERGEKQRNERKEKRQKQKTI